MSSVSDCELSSISISSLPPPQKIQNNSSLSSVSSLYNKIYSWDTVVIIVLSVIGTIFIITLITTIVGMAGAL